MKSKMLKMLAVVIACLLCFAACGKTDAGTEPDNKPVLCADGHKGVFECEVCGLDFIEEFKKYVDENKGEQGFIPITGSNYWGVIQYTDEYPIYISLNVDLGRSFSYSFILAYKKAYSSSKWMYVFQMLHESVSYAEMTGSFKTIDDGYYLPYDSGKSDLRPEAYKMYLRLTNIVQQSFDATNSGLIIQYFGLNI